MCAREIGERESKQCARGRDELRIIRAQAKPRRAGRGRCNIYVGIVGKRGMGMMIEQLDSLDLRQQATIDRRGRGIDKRPRLSGEVGRENGECRGGDGKPETSHERDFTRAQPRRASGRRPG